MTDQLTTYLLFILCVALGTWVQNLTGFAFSLLLQGMVATLNVASVADTANAATVLSLTNAWTYFRAHRVTPPWQLMKPALISGPIGVVAGLLMLGWLSGNAIEWLRDQYDRTASR